MAHLMNNRNLKYLILIPIITLILNAMYFRYLTKEIENALLKEKYVEIVDSIDMLTAAVNAIEERKWIDHEQNIIESVEFLDKIYQIYAGAYKIVDGEPLLITERFYETSIFEPFDFKEFEDLIYNQDKGNIIIGYTPENQTYRELHIYFKWMPLYSAFPDRYLVVAGVSSYSVTARAAEWVSVGQWASMIITFALNILLVSLITKLGYIYEARNGDPWRENKKRRS